MIHAAFSAIIVNSWKWNVWNVHYAGLRNPTNSAVTNIVNTTNVSTATWSSSHPNTTYQQKKKKHATTYTITARTTLVTANSWTGHFCQCTRFLRLTAMALTLAVDQDPHFPLCSGKPVIPWKFTTITTQTTLKYWRRNTTLLQPPKFWNIYTIPEPNLTDCSIFSSRAVF